MRQWIYQMKTAIFFIFSTTHTLKLSAALILALIFTACSSQKNYDDLQRQTLMYSQRAKFTHKGENVSILVSYLNPSLNLWKDDDIFVLSVSPKDTDTELIKTRFWRYQGVLKPVKADARLAKYLVNSPFMAHYMVRFPYKDDDSISLQLCFATQCVELSFQKYSKSLFYRPEDADK